MNRPSTNLKADLRLREALRFVAANTLQSVIASALVAGGLVFWLRDSIHPWAALSWMTALVCVGALRLWLRRRVRAALDIETFNPRHLVQFTALALATGMIWASGVWVLRPSEDGNLHAVVLLTCAAIGIGGAFASVASLRTAMAIFWPPIMALTLFGWMDGSKLYLIIASISLPLSLVVTRMLVVLNRQFVEQVELREQNAELLRALQQRTADAETANEAKSRFLAAASHDLRQPMHAIVMRSRALVGQPLPEDVRMMVERLDHSVVAMQSLFDALLDISKFDTGSVRTHLAPLPVQSLFNVLIESYSYMAQQQGVQLHMDATTLWVNSDARLLGSILRQLVDNTMRHAGPCRVTLRARPVGDDIAIEVWDTGKGIPHDQQLNIFKEFVQLQNPERDRRKGLGLGLAIVERTAHQLGHRLELESREGAGACFRIFVPMLKTQPAAAAQPVAAPQPKPVRPKAIEPVAARPVDSPVDAPAPVPAASVTSSASTTASAAPAPTTSAASVPMIALLDDDPDVLEAMALLLTHWRYEVISATHSDELLQALREKGRIPDLLVCDYRLAEKRNGREIIEDMRRHFGQALPALLITGDIRALNPSELGSGIIVLRKPVPPDTLREMVATHSTRRMQAASASSV
jgi:two-component system, sensor histidine kinase